MSSVVLPVSLPASSLLFDGFELLPHERQLLARGTPVILGNRAFDLLLILGQRAGQLVTKSELLDFAWPGLVVEEHNIATQISTLRKLLGNGLIATVPGRGYRFTARVVQAARAGDGVSPLPAAWPPGHARLPKMTAPAVSPNSLTNLPAVLAPMIGRQTELAELAALVAGNPLVTVIGLGGFGKTLLVQKLLEAAQPGYEHGVCWVDLAGLSDGQAVPSAIATALGTPLGSGEPLAGLCAGVSPLHLLLALDNAEHLVEAVARVAESLIAAAPRLKLVITSQVPLQLRAERIFRLGGLGVPRLSREDGCPTGDGGSATVARRDADSIGAADALAHGAVALFVERARFADRHFELTDANARTVCVLCQRLDGCALALELAAARMPMLGIHALLGSMDERMRVLTRGHRDAPARQQTLRATLDWSHALLSKAEQVVFRRMAVFVGSAALADVRAVVSSDESGTGLDDWMALDLLGTLVDRSLVSLVSVPDSDEPRYRLLETPRAYALEQLIEAKEEDAVRHRHAQAMARRMDPLLLHGLGREALPGGDDRSHPSPDRDNMREAWAWSYRQGETELAIKIATALLSGLPMSAYTEKAAIAEAGEAMADAHGFLPGPLRVWFWWNTGWHWSNVYSRRRQEAALKCVTAAREPDAVPGHAMRLYMALGMLAMSSSSIGNANEADLALAEMKLTECAGWPPIWRLAGLRMQAIATSQLDRHRQARLLAVESVELHRTLGQDMAHSVSTLANLELAAGNTAAAVQVGIELITLLDGTRNQQELTIARMNLCAAWMAAGDVEAACQLARSGWTQALRFDFQPFWGDHLALLAALQQNFEVAAQLNGYADAGYRRYGAAREINEANSVARARTLARAGLGDAAFEQWRLAGESLRDDEIELLVFRK